MCRNFKNEAPAEVCCAFIPFSPVCDGLLTCYHLVFGQGGTMEVWSEINKIKLPKNVKFQTTSPSQCGKVNNTISAESCIIKPRVGTKL